MFHPKYITITKEQKISTSLCWSWSWPRSPWRIGWGLILSCNQLLGCNWFRGLWNLAVHPILIIDCKASCRGDAVMLVSECRGVRAEIVFLIPNCVVQYEGNNAVDVFLFRQVCKSVVVWLGPWAPRSKKAFHNFESDWRRPQFCSLVITSTRHVWWSLVLLSVNFFPASHRNGRGRRVRCTMCCEGKEKTSSYEKLTHLIYSCFSCGNL